MDYQVDRAEVLRYLGYAGQQADPALFDRIDSIIKKAEEGLVPRSVSAVFPIEVHPAPSWANTASTANAATDTRAASTVSAADPDSSTCATNTATPSAAASGPYVDVVGTSLRLEGYSIVEHLEGATECVLLACTLGAKSEQELTRLNVLNPLDALIYDAACSALIERAADAAEAELVAAAAARGMHTNWRYGPGYGDLPLSVQPQFLSVLKAYETIGLTVTETNLLLPTKSITAVFGLFPKPWDKEKPRICTTCNMRDFCTIRAAGRTCHA